MTLKYSYFLLLTLFLLASCGSDDEYAPTNTEDTESPSAARNLMTTNITETSLELTWDSATDNVAVSGYKVFQDNVEITSSVQGTSFSVTNLTTETTYAFYVTAYDAAGNESSQSNTVTATTLDEPFGFKPNISQMGVFSGVLSDLIPADGVQLYELNSTLFTDYTTKQRLVKLPTGGALQYNGNDLLPTYPDETLIAKTFYYNIDDRDPSLGQQIIETRIFLKINGIWEVGDYIWNAAQTDATFTSDGSEIPISYIDNAGETQNVAYLIPSQQDCFTCHNNQDITAPIGMKLRSMNFQPSYTSQNQLDFFITNGLLEGISSSAGVSVLPNWEDATLDINDRGRAYLDINCAHCHRPGSSVPAQFDMDFRLETPYADSKIYDKRFSIEIRFSNNIEGYRMPVLGRTVIHQEALAMLQEYLGQLDEPN